VRLCHEVNIPAPFARCWLEFYQLGLLGSLEWMLSCGDGDGAAAAAGRDWGTDSGGGTKIY